jgi:hypothetical protein
LRELKRSDAVASPAASDVGLSRKYAINRLKRYKKEVSGVDDESDVEQSNHLTPARPTFAIEC